MPRRRLSFFVDEEEHKAYKSILAAEGKDMSDHLRKFVQEYIKQKTKGKK